MWHKKTEIYLNHRKKITEQKYVWTVYCVYFYKIYNLTLSTLLDYYQEKWKLTVSLKYAPIELIVAILSIIPIWMKNQLINYNINWMLIVIASTNKKKQILLHFAAGTF